ncbi:MAG: TlpA disulfide reductase family protein [Gemmatimonadota bacterium]|nr:TlpA disulfide reductase family protein [Gemmatimonadota bacterium]
MKGHGSAGLRAAVLLLPPALVGCGDALVLRDPETGLQLAYSCSEPATQARSTSETALVLSYGRRLARFLVAEGGDASALETAIAARERGEWSTYERTVVELLCQDRQAMGDAAALHAADLWFGGEPDPAYGLEGDRAPAFALPVLSEAFFAGEPEVESLDDYRGRYVLLDFWASWCWPCRAEYQGLAELEPRFRDRGLRVLGIVYRDSPRRALRFMEEQDGPTYASLVDEGNAVARRYRVRGLPTKFLVGPGRRIAEVLVGGGRPGAMEALAHRLDSVLPARPAMRSRPER